MERKGRDFAKYQEQIFCIEAALAQDPMGEAEGCVKYDPQLKWDDIEKCAKVSNKFKRSSLVIELLRAC